ncbi:MAG: hypothetical protein ACI89L_000629 [Phycisphaerales bacterium]|jgi:hypothetical protein
MKSGCEKAGGPTLHRREFLVVASSVAITPIALGGVLGGAVSEARAAPTSATLVPGAMGTAADATARGRFATRPPMTLSHKACRLTIETMESAAGADGAASVEVVYPTPGARHVAWAARGEEVPGPIMTLAPTDALGRVRLRVSVGGVGAEPMVREFVYPSTPGTHLLAIPMREGARLPSWRRCRAEMSDGRVDGVTDDWRPSGAAPGCVLLRVTLSPLNDELNDNENRAQAAPMEAPDAR